MMESEGFEVWVILGSIDTVSRAPHLAAPPDAFRSRAVCSACKLRCLCCRPTDMYPRSFPVLPQVGVCAVGFLFLMEEELQRRAAGGEQQRQPRPSISMCCGGRVFQRHVMAIEFSMLSSPQWTLFSALSGSLVERGKTRMRMSLRSRESFALTNELE